MELVRPGSNIRIVTDVDPTKETISVKTSTIYDISDPVILAAQSDPPLGPSLVGRTVMITYVNKEGGTVIRYGFPARIDALVDYDLAGGETVQAIRMEREGDIRPHSIRMFHRVEPLPDGNLRLFIAGKEMKILDISLGGVRFTLDGSISLGAGRIEDIYVDIGQRSYNLRARICRTWESTDVRSWKEPGFASAEFLGAPHFFERVLVRQLRQIERNSRVDKEQD
jgi:hypothetical protein